MVRDQIERRGIKERRLLAALRNVPRHEFVPPSQRDIACHDGPLSIGHDQTISQPYIVAFMTDALRLEGHEKVLEIGTGSGYQTAILAELARSVFTIEIIEPLGREAEERLLRMNYGNIAFRIGNGRGGWPEETPFDRIIITAAPEHDLLVLPEQLADGGIMVLPVGKGRQVLKQVKRSGERFSEDTLLDVRFVPLL